MSAHIESYKLTNNEHLSNIRGYLSTIFAIDFLGSFQFSYLLNRILLHLHCKNILIFGGKSVAKLVIQIRLYISKNSKLSERFSWKKWIFDEMLSSKSADDVRGATNQSGSCISYSGIEHEIRFIDLNESLEFIPEPDRR